MEFSLTLTSCTFVFSPSLRDMKAPKAAQMRAANENRPNIKARVRKMVKESIWIPFRCVSLQENVVWQRPPKVTRERGILLKGRSWKAEAIFKVDR